MVDETQSSSDPKKQTPPKWKTPKDARNNQQSGQYPNYWVRKTRSGHTIIMDDSEGNEHVTFQHRSGSMIQMLPDGAVQHVSHNGQYTVVFGENRMYVTGSHDITVTGDASIRCEGNYNATVKGDLNWAVAGNFGMTAKSMNFQANEQFDVVADRKSEKITNTATTQAGGAISMVASKGMTLKSLASLAIGASGDVGIAAKGQVALESGGLMSILAHGETAIQGTKIWNNSGKAASASQIISMPGTSGPTNQPDSGVSATPVATS